MLAHVLSTFCMQSICQLTKCTDDLCLQTDARNARANQIKLDADQLERLLFQLFERKVSCLFLAALSHGTSGCC